MGTTTVLVSVVVVCGLFQALHSGGTAIFRPPLPRGTSMLVGLRRSRVQPAYVLGAWALDIRVLGAYVQSLCIFVCVESDLLSFLYSARDWPFIAECMAIH